ncbi:MAG: cupredoxin family copper-binding protein [Planctomycetota bacterium]
MIIHKTLLKISFLSAAFLLLSLPLSAATFQVDIQSFSFNPNNIQINAGDTVTWVNMMSVGHTSTSDAGLWGSPLLMMNDAWSYTFNVPGQYSYHCTPHPSMKGGILVGDISLTTDTSTISASSGGMVNFTLDAGPIYANRPYILLGSITGIEPGTPLPGGFATLPLNFDVFTDIVFSLLNTPVCSNFLSTLDNNGASSAVLNTGGPLPAAAGLVMWYAFALGNPFNFTSSVVHVAFVL